MRSKGLSLSAPKRDGRLWANALAESLEHANAKERLDLIDIAKVKNI